MSIWWSLHLRREAASVPLARRLLVGAMETAGVDPETAYDLAVALSEACANAVEHGGDASTGYRVTARIDGDTCRIEVTDSGPGFSRTRSPASPAALEDRHRLPRRGEPRTPAPAHDEHGRGLFLIESLTDNVRVRNRPGRQGAVVTFDKILKWREDALLKAS
ncbi:ATP-binding protein [Streptomyces huiliensis]|uniref:ATP-binding protein n=1 Tax=Streptomyces huiliensis TaxID=2876027 RepID=UPI001CBA8F37|nr:ATP-binding protein [Streptomyces huiliensis]MBZ4323100.1 ATP-binding protein [Streptomyces huiliensis]